MILACLILLILLVIVSALLLWRSQPAPADVLMREHLLERYVVTVDAGETFSGLLAAVDDRTLVLRDVRVLLKDTTTSPVDGDIFLRRESVSYLQRPT